MSDLNSLIGRYLVLVSQVLQTILLVLLSHLSHSPKSFSTILDCRALFS